MSTTSRLTRCFAPSFGSLLTKAKKQFTFGAKTQFSFLALPVVINPAHWELSGTPTSLL